MEISKEGDLLIYNKHPFKLFGLDYTEMVYIENGSFKIDNNSSTISFLSGFYIGKYLVTKELYNLVIGEGTSHKEKYCPVETISYNEISNNISGFFVKLNAIFRSEYPDLKGVFTLPSETQWEYSARGGKLWNRPLTNFSGSQNICSVAWYRENSDGNPIPVGLQEPNVLNLYDMSGNVFEWCADWFQRDLKKIPKDGTPLLNKGTHRVIRGGSRFSSENECNLNYRYLYSPENRDNAVGFRLVFLKS